MHTYKPSKTVKEQVEYLESNKRVVFNEISKKEAEEILFKYGYINVITPYKHRFAKKDKGKVVKDETGRHIYERDVDFKEYYDLYVNERKKYPTISANVIYFETRFRSILSYTILNSTDINCDSDLMNFLESIRLRISQSNNYSEKRLEHMNESISKLENNIEKYHDVYCFFDNLSLGESLTLFNGLDYKTQDKIFDSCKSINIHFNVDKTPDFASKVFTLVSVRNCVMHCNSLEVLKRFFNPKYKTLRDRKSTRTFESMINYLSSEKAHTEWCELSSDLGSIYDSILH